MTPTELRFDLMRDLYRCQRDRREQIRSSVATPVAALAFSVFNLSTLATHYEVAAHPINLTIAVIGILSIIALLLGAALIVRIERNFVYLDPPDLAELVNAERIIRSKDNDQDEHVLHGMQDVLAAAYDIIYRRYFSANEQAARDRTLGLRLILFALGALAVVFLLLPLQAEEGAS